MENQEVLYLKYRPSKFSELVGQDEAVKTLTDLGKRGAIPHAMLMTGPSGCGKTTIARILKSKLKCIDEDFNEMNCANHRGIDDIRAIDQTMRASSLGGAGYCRIWLMDECHALTSDAQSALLKMLEDTPKHVYFFLATTNPEKLKPTIKTRCTEIRCRALTEAGAVALVQRTAAAEGKPVAGNVATKIAVAAAGSARKALVLLHAVIGLPTEADQLNAVEKADSEAQTLELCRLLMNKSPWPAVAKVLENLDEEPETVRRAVLGYARSTLLKSGKARADDIIKEFRYDLFASGAAGLASACYALCFD